MKMTGLRRIRVSEKLKTEQVNRDRQSTTQRWSTLPTLILYLKCSKIKWKLTRTASFIITYFSTHASIELTSCSQRRTLRSKNLKSSRSCSTLLTSDLRNHSDKPSLQKHTVTSLDANCMTTLYRYVTRNSFERKKTSLCLCRCTLVALSSKI